MLHAALADVAGVAPASAGHVLTGVQAENSSGAALFLQLFDAAVAYDALQLTAARLCATSSLIAAGWTAAGAGVGKTLTAPSTATSHNDFDGVTANLNDRILVKGESGANERHNGVYAITTLGDGVAASAVLTRVTDFDQVAEVVVDAYIRVTAGATLASTGWRQTATVAAVDINPITWAAAWAPLLALRVPNNTRIDLSALDHARGGVPFATGLAWGWSSVRDSFVAFAGAASGVAAWLLHEAP